MSEPRRLEPSVWEIPVGYVPGMRVPGIVYANDELFAKAVEDRAVEQVANVATLPGIVGVPRKVKSSIAATRACAGPTREPMRG